MRTIGYLIAALIGLFWFLANFSAVETKYACSGAFTPSAKYAKSQVFFRLTSYRFWVGLWSKSDGNLWVEVPDGGTLRYFAHLRQSNDIFAVYDSAGGEFFGNFSTLSNRLNLKLGSGMLFEGDCSQL
jgi:hypothetical protein